jgi:hypothetical protein
VVERVVTDMEMIGDGVVIEENLIRGEGARDRVGSDRDGRGLGCRDI